MLLMVIAACIVLGLCVPVLCVAGAWPVAAFMTFMSLAGIYAEVQPGSDDAGDPWY